MLRDRLSPLPFAAFALGSILLAACGPRPDASSAASPDSCEALRPAEEHGGAAALSREIRDTDGRAIVGFKPADRDRGVEDGRRLLDSAAVDSLVERFTPCVIEEVLSRYGIIPAVSARLRPERVGWLLADPRVDYVEPDRVVEPDESDATSPGG